MTDILSSLLGQLGPSAVQQISQQLGAPPGATQSAIQAALPTLLTALANNARTPQGAQALGSALERDHDGSVLNNLSGFLGGGAAARRSVSVRTLAVTSRSIPASARVSMQRAMSSRRALASAR